VNIVSVQTKEYRRPLHTPIKTSQGVIDHRSGIILAAGGADSVGFGEVNFPLYNDDPDYERRISSIKNLLSATLDAITGLPIPSSLDDVTAGLKPILPASHPAVYFGVETALCDLAAKVVGRPLNQWLRPMAKSSVQVNYLMPRPVDDWDDLAAFVRNRGYRAVKVKVGSRAVDEDVAIVQKLRETLGGDIRIRLDANRGWELETATDACNRLKEYSIEYIEEPLATFDIDQLAALSKTTGIRFALDESLTDIDDVETAISHPARPVLIFKPARIGGMARTRSTIKRANKDDCPVVITSNLETEIGTAALLHLAAAAYTETPPCGLDTMRMFDNPDPALTDVGDGKIALPSGPGLGIGESLWQSL